MGLNLTAICAYDTSSFGFMLRRGLRAVCARLRNSGVPVSLSLLVVAVLVFLLQVVPIPGIFLMFMLASLWPVFLVNGAMIGSAVEAGTGRVHKSWLLLPAAYFGMYFAAAAWQHATLAALRGDIAAGNASVRIPFDPARDALVVQAPAAASYLVNHYDIPVVYVQGQSGNATTDGTHAVRLEYGPLCRQLNTGYVALLGAGVSITPVVDYPRSFELMPPGQAGFCDVSTPEALPAGALRAETVRTRQRRNMMPVALATITLRRPDGMVVAVLRGGTASPLSWLPRPVAGCFLNDAAPSWNCDAGFLRDDFQTLQAGQPFGAPDEAVLATALNLRAVTPAERHGATDDAVLRVRVQALQHLAMTRALEALDGLIAGAQRTADFSLMSTLRGRADLLASRVPGMVAAIEGYVFKKQGAGSPAIQMFDLLRALPANMIAPYAARLDKVWYYNRSFALGRNEAVAIDAMPERCLKPAQRGMTKYELTRDIAARRNDAISDEDLVAAFRDPDCYPAVGFGSESVLGLYHGATVKLGFANGHVAVFMTPEQRSTYSAAYNRYESVWVPRQTCAGVGGGEVWYGEVKYCVPGPAAPLMLQVAESLPR